jgi:hypothetical protein
MRSINCQGIGCGASVAIIVPSELPQPAGSSRLTAMRMFELRFL